MPAAANAAAGQDRPEREERSMFDKLKYFIIFFAISQMVTGFFNNKYGGDQKNQPQTQQSSGSSNGQTPDSVLNTPKPKASELTVYPYWHREESFNVQVWVSDQKAGPGYGVVVADLHNVSYGSGDIKFESTVDIELPGDFVEKNSTLYANVIVTKLSGEEPKGYRSSKPITEYIEQKKKTKKKHLIGKHDDEDGEEVDDTPALIVPHFHPNISLAFVDTWDAIPIHRTHPETVGQIPIDPEFVDVATDGINKIGKYYPIIYNNEFWHLSSQMQEINSTVTSIPFQFSLYEMSFWKFQIMSSTDAGMKDQVKQGAAGAAELEEVKRVLIETNPILLGITIVVSLLHTLFEFLAFKNDISHWRNKKDTIGVSVRTIVANVVMQTITFLYLVDNSENTNNMILLTQGLGIFVEAWKITKAVDIKFNHNGKWISVTDKHELTDSERKTKEYDGIIFKYLYIVAVPLIGAYGVYSLLYDTHKSWRSFFITVAVQCVYAYGFLLLIPPVYINYRLKSVAHMSMRAMIYKTLNTFIDDLFSFVIKMPWLHRLMTLRDDVIFVIYLYQSWAYRVDYSRVNELGLGGDGETLEEEDEKKNK